MNSKTIEAKTQMMIRKPVGEVFAAFIDPEITKNFWFTKGSGKVETGAKLRWDWEMYGASAELDVKAVEENKRILIRWDDGDEVEWLFIARATNETEVHITNRGFSGSDETIVAKALDSVGGFTTVLCGLKAYLEHGIRLNLIADKYPDAIVTGS
jgi:uncharacterized protein YndB with AHSA1/START domain